MNTADNNEKKVIEKWCMAGPLIFLLEPQAKWGQVENHLIWSRVKWFRASGDF